MNVTCNINGSYTLSVNCDWYWENDLDLDGFFSPINFNNLVKWLLEDLNDLYGRVAF